MFSFLPRCLLSRNIGLSEKVRTCAREKTCYGSQALYNILKQLCNYVSFLLQVILEPSITATSQTPTTEKSTVLSSL